jgi:hypothetical protein
MIDLGLQFSSAQPFPIATGRGGRQGWASAAVQPLVDIETKAKSLTSNSPPDQPAMSLLNAWRKSR